MTLFRSVYNGLKYLLAGDMWPPYVMSIIDMGAVMATNVHLTAELERFARECVAGGGYNNVSEVVRSGLRLLQEAEDRRRQFHTMLQKAEREADRDGTFSIDSVLAELDEIIAVAEK